MWLGVQLLHIVREATQRAHVIEGWEGLGWGGAADGWPAEEHELCLRGKRRRGGVEAALGARRVRGVTIVKRK